MKLNPNKLPSQDTNISKTGYRALFLLMKLLEAPKSRAELIECAAQDAVLNKDFSKDTITNTINILKKAGCIISRPSQKTNNKYVLKFHPFSMTFPEECINALQTFRDNISATGDWKMVAELNNLYEKIVQLTETPIHHAILLYEHPLKNINFKIIRELEMGIAFQQLLNIKYKSPQSGEENFDIIPKFISFENNKLYIWCYNSKYNETSYLRIDRITGINSITFDKDIVYKTDKSKETEFTAVYELRDESEITYWKSEGEKILEHNKEKEFPLRIESVVKNKFNFYQKILAYGSDCRIVAPEFARKEFLDLLKQIKSEYANDI